MAQSKKALHEAIRAKYMALVGDFLNAKDEEVLQTGSNEFSIPCVDSEGNDEFIIITFKVPTGSRDGEAYDGYTAAEMYREKTAEKKAKAEETKIAREKKAARDKAEREAKAKAKAEHKAQVGR